MTKDDLVSLLRSAGVEENAVNLAMNAFDIGYEVGELAGYHRHLENLKIIGERYEPKTDK
jgi:hypothetical protein